MHWEIEARDAELMKKFYAEMFNWNIGEGPIMNIDAGFGGPEPGPGGHIRETGTSRVTLYIQVLDLAASVAKAKELGGEVVFERFDIPDGASLASITDPEGNPVMLVQQ